MDYFEEMQDFVDQCVLDYNLNLETYIANMMDGLDVFLKSNPVSKCILMGTR